MNRLFYRCEVLVLLAVAVTASPAQSQITQPPRQDTQSSTGVSYRSGAFNYSENDLQIGGNGPEGIILRRNYISNLAGGSVIWTHSTGWTDNFNSQVTNHPYQSHPDFDQPPANAAIWVYNINTGLKTYGFIGGTNGGSVQAPSHVPWGPYMPISRTGAKLVFNGTTPSGYFTLTEADGTVTNFSPGVSNARVTNVTFSDGTVWTYTYAGLALKSVFSSRGYAILVDSPGKVCVVNRSSTYITATSSCPAAASSVTYGYTAGVYRPAVSLLTSVTKSGSTVSYGYNSADELSCITDPGMSACRISNEYNVCLPNSWDPSDNAGARRFKDAVVSQQTATGETYSYAITPAPCNNLLQGEKDYYPWTASSTTVTARDGTRTIVGTTTGGLPFGFTDQLNRVTTSQYEGSSSGVDEEIVDVAAVYSPEGNRTWYQRDDRGNIFQANFVPKPGSGLPTLTTTAGYEVTCSNPRTCNKPNWFKDTKGAQTDYTYAPHGGVATETQPAGADGVRPQKRYTYVQRTASVSDGSGYVAAGAPIWLLAEMRTCRTTATSGNACVGGPADEVVTGYDYGPTTGPNTLLLRGVTVTADGQTLRTCYSYDGLGRRVSETQPRAGLTSCY